MIYKSTGWVKKVSPKAFNNILAFAKLFWAKYYSVVDNLYPHVYQIWGVYIKNLMHLGSIFHNYPHFYYHILSIATWFWTLKK